MSHQDQPRPARAARSHPVRHSAPAQELHAAMHGDPTWKPPAQFTQGGKFGIAQLIAQAQQA